MARFDPEKMAVYRLAREHTREMHALLKRVNAKGFSDLITQIRSSSISIPANIMEATGEWRRGKRLHYLMIAKGSTFESWAHTDALVDLGLVPVEAISELRELQNRITALLIRTIHNLETSAPSRKQKRQAM